MIGKITAVSLRIMAYTVRKRYEREARAKMQKAVNEFLESNRTLQNETLEEILAEAGPAAQAGQNAINYRVMRDKFKDASSNNLRLHYNYAEQEDEKLYEQAINKFGKRTSKKLKRKGFQVEYKYDRTRCDCRRDDMCPHSNGRYYLEFEVRW